MELCLPRPLQPQVDYILRPQMDYLCYGRWCFGEGPNQSSVANDQVYREPLHLLRCVFFMDGVVLVEFISEIRIVLEAKNENE